MPKYTFDPVLYEKDFRQARIDKFKKNLKKEMGKKNPDKFLITVLEKTIVRESIDLSLLLL